MRAEIQEMPSTRQSPWRTWTVALVASGSIAIVTLLGGALPAQVERQAALKPLAPVTAAAAAVPAATLPEGMLRLPLPEVMRSPAPRAPGLVRVELETRELDGLLADGVGYRFWTFNGTVPGPMVRVFQGDTVEIALRNASDSHNVHSINLHAATGPGGGAALTQVAPAAESAFRFQALHPGVYVYHCMTPIVGQHVANGMYGMIIVEPPQGLPPVDREFYLMQGDYYPQGAYGEAGLQAFDRTKLLQERPEYVVFNGSVGAYAGDTSLRARVGETIRIFFGVGGPNLDSSFHIVGESFDRVWQEGAREFVSDVQTTQVPPGGATMVEFKAEVPGMYMIEDHHITRLEKGAWAHLVVDGPEQPDIFVAVP
jgi:nitrite reductase (NO-forming)